MPTKMKTQKMHFENADIIFVDPCYFAKDDGVWEEYCEDFAQNKNLDKLGCEQSICISVGDVSPDVLVNENDGSVLGSICTDSYVLGCFKLEDVLEYNPEYDNDNKTLKIVSESILMPPERKRRAASREP